MSPRSTSSALAACVLWLLCAGYTARFVDRGWIPHDEGTIAQSAERTLRGEMPHRDFDEVYTGGLTYLHAAAMQAWGVSLRAPRFTLFAFFMAFVAAAYAIARRVAPGWSAIVATALVVAWSVPNYFVSLPSWYTLFFATFGTLALLRFLEVERRRWLIAAGACGGLSILMKITGVFYVAGGLLFLAYVEQSRAAGHPRAGAQRSRFWPVVGIPAGLLLFLLLSQVWSHTAGSALLPVLLPAVGVCAFVVWREWTAGRGAVVDRVRCLFALVWPFAVGVAIPVLAFGWWYWQQGAVMDLVRGVLVLPQRRLTEASLDPPPLATIGLAVPYAVLLIAGHRGGVRREPVLAVALFALLGAVLYGGQNPVVYRVAWGAARAMPLVAVVTLIWMLVERPDNRGGVELGAPRLRAQLVLLVTMAAFVALVQFPYATPTYFCYGAAMTVLALSALVAAQPRAPRRVHLAVAAFFFAFALVFVNQSYGWNLGVAFIPYHPDSLLDLDRGGLRVPADDKQTYEELVRVLRQHAAGGTIYAGPDCPEVYFLSGFPNATRAIFELLTPERQDAAWMAGVLARSPIRAAVINTQPSFSRPLDPGVVTMLERRFPSSLRVGRFVVRFE